MKINVRAEFESTPIRHIAIQCPHCKNWFRGWDLVDDWDCLRYSYQIDMANYHCPMCEKDFGGVGSGSELNINRNLSTEEIYKDYKTQRVTWE